MVSYRRLAMRVLGHVPVPFGKKKASPPPRVAAQRIAALALACAMMTGMALPAFADTYDIAKGSIEIHAKEGSNFITQWLDENRTEYYSDSRGRFDGTYKDPDNNITITGTSTGNTVTIDADKDQTAKVTLDNVEINASSTGQAAVNVTGSGDTNIELNGNNTLTGGVAHAGLEHNKKTDANETSGKLTITDTDGNGSLCATGNYGGAGIGGGNFNDAGKIEITGGSITATGGTDGAGIGGGGSGGDADITISGGTINAFGGTINAIGGTDPSGQQDPIGGAGIGGGGSGGDATVTITGGAVIEQATGGGGCAGIGGGYSSESDVTISGNATIETVTGGKQSAGIGGGGRTSTGTVTIKDNATIKEAQGGDGGAGIGGGVYGSTKVFIEGSPTIESTTGGNNGAGIGCGAGGKGTVNIKGNAEIQSAQGNSGGAGIGGGAGGDGNVTITGNAEIQSAQGGSYGAGIGGGAIASFDGTNFIGGKGTVIIDGNTIINAQGGEEGAGIGGGMGGLGYVTITGNAEIQNATGGTGAAGIGGGAESEPDDDGTGNKTRNEISIKSTEAGSPNITAKGGKASDDGLSGGAAIGSGSVYENDPQYPEEKASAAITIEGKVTIAATAGGKLADKDAIAIGDTPLKEQKFAGLLVGAVIKRWDSAGVDLTLKDDKPTEPDQPSNPDQPSKPGQPGTDNPGTGNPDTDNPGTENPDTNKPGTGNPDTNKPDTDKPDTDKPDTDKPDTDKPDTDKPDTDKPDTDKPDTDKPGTDKPDTDKPDTDKPDTDKPNPEQPSEPSGAVSTSAPAEELTASDAEYLVTVEGLSVTNALGKQITHSCTQNVQGKVLTIRTNSIVATAHLTMETLRTLKAQGVETIRFCTLLYRPTSVSIDALLNLGVDEADILWTHNGIQARLTVGGTDSSSLLQ